jgi:hypothetical protein
MRYGDLRYSMTHRIFNYSMTRGILYVINSSGGMRHLILSQSTSSLMRGILNNSRKRHGNLTNNIRYGNFLRHLAASNIKH